MLPSLSPLSLPRFSPSLSDLRWQDECSLSEPVLMCGWMTPLKACLAAAPAISGSEVFGSAVIDSCQVWHCQPDTVCSNCLLSLPLFSSPLAPRHSRRPFSPLAQGAPATVQLECTSEGPHRSTTTVSRSRKRVCLKHQSSYFVKLLPTCAGKRPKLGICRNFLQRGKIGSLILSITEVLTDCDQH